MVETVRLVLGAFINIEMWIMLFLNVLVLTCIMKSRLYAKKDNAVYILTGFNIFCEICQIILHILYIGPAIISGSWFFKGQDSLGVTVTAVIFLGLWYLGSLMQILFAVNRLVVICFPWSALFSRKRVVYFIVICCCAALGMVLYSQLLSPCCRITPDPFVYSYSYLVFPNESQNLSMYFVDLPLDSGTSLFCGISYVALFVHVHRVGAADVRTRTRELRCCIQFILMFLTYTIAWLTFFVYPALRLREHAAYSVTLIVLVVNSGVNSIIYLALNTELNGPVASQGGWLQPKESRWDRFYKTIINNDFSGRTFSTQATRQ
ncbi:hypothetical protein Y032_0239g3332 [Ancylostoma ceylanicum]|uniref:G-protein coupled receptors family 1 profile domain-containing protein n=1 Tax=Ancylostoma ceylanicum TaxID=53326 RepID=A0A016SF23_9BILA|nr:hypothetical protein Y032_0239g3332 [Ancylostoma ceylanicum]